MSEQDPETDEFMRRVRQLAAEHDEALELEVIALMRYLRRESGEPPSTSTLQSLAARIPSGQEPPTEAERGFARALRRWAMRSARRRQS